MEQVTIDKAIWTMSKCANNYDEWNLYDDTDDCHGIYLGYIKGKRNAILAKAAPQLLAACINALEDGDDHHAMQVLREAISEATSK